MQFKVPQFLDIEDTVFGPFTAKQFVYLAGGGGICFIIFKLLGFLLGILPALVVAAFALALAFWRPNNKPFVSMVEYVFRYAFQDKLYIWKRRKADKHKSDKSKNELPLNEVTGERPAKLSGSKLRDLAWSLDVLDLKKENKSN